MSDFNAIMEKMLSKIPDTFDKRQGSIIYDALAPSAMELAQMYINFEIFKEQTYLLYATGLNLDNRAGDFAMERYSATHAVRIAKLYNSIGGPIDVNIGKKFATPNERGGLIYVAIDRLDKGLFLLKAELAGTQGNEYYGDILPLFILNNLAKAEIVGTEIPGRDTETDDDFRQRIIERMSQKAFGGNIADYKNFTKAIDGVGDLKVFPVWNGGGTVKLSIVDNLYNPITQNFMNNIKNMIDPQEETGLGIGIAPIGHVVTISTPEKLLIHINATVTLDNRTIGQVQSDIEKNIDNYLLAVRQDWANAISSNVFIARISEAILKVSAVVNVRDITINDKSNDLYIESTPTLQQLPFLRSVNLVEG